MYHDVSPTTATYSATFPDLAVVSGCLRYTSAQPRGSEHTDTLLAKEPFNHDEVVATCKKLISQMPRANQYLLLYVLDLLSVFARKSDKNLMTASSMYPTSTYKNDYIDPFSRPGSNLPSWTDITPRS